jgi:hypothetical protein
MTIIGVGRTLTSARVLQRKPAQQELKRGLEAPRGAGSPPHSGGQE